MVGRTSQELGDYFKNDKKSKKNTLHKVYVYSNPKKPELGELVTISIENKLEAVLEIAPASARFFYNSRTAPVIVIRPEDYAQVAKVILQQWARL